MANRDELLIIRAARAGQAVAQLALGNGIYLAEVVYQKVYRLLYIGLKEQRNKTKEMHGF